MKPSLPFLSIVTAGLAAGAAVVALATTSVTAFPFNKSWHEPATGVAGTNRAGAGGIYGTGGRTDHGIKCAHCHVRGAGQIGMTLTASPAFGTVGGDSAYTPGQRYNIAVAMTGEHLAVGANENLNSMALTIENASGARSGRFIADSGQDSMTCSTANPYPGAPGAVSPAGRTTFVYGDCHGVLPLDHNGLTRWVFDWVAPAAGAGDLTIFLGIVDGDSRGKSSLDDDTLDRAIPLRQGP